MPVALLLALLLGATPAHAHGLLDGHLPQRLPIWLGAALLLGAWCLYLLGCRRVPPRRTEFWLFQAGVVLAWLAMFGPLDEWAEANAAWHMTQHMLLMLVIAPLWVLARPLPQWRARCGGRLDRLWRMPLRAARLPMLTALLHGALIWLWHAPGPYRLALEHPWWHLLEHACFLFSAWLFWWSVLRAAPRRQGEAQLALLLTSMHTGLLGALLTFARLPLYRDAGDIGDQQLAGLLMWVPGGVVYLAAAGWCGQRWLRRLWLRRGQPG